MNWTDPRERTLDDLWEAAQKAAQWRSPYLGFTGVTANMTGKGGWTAATWGLGSVRGWGGNPRLALGDLIVKCERRLDEERESLWFEQQEANV